MHSSALAPVRPRSHLHSFIARFLSLNPPLLPPNEPYPIAAFADEFLCAENQPKKYEYSIFFFFFTLDHICFNFRTVATWFEQFAACFFSSRITASHYDPSGVFKGGRSAMRPPSALTIFL